MDRADGSNLRSEIRIVPDFDVTFRHPGEVFDNGQFVYDLSSWPEATRGDLDRDVDCTIDSDFSGTEREALSPPHARGTFTSTARRELEGVIVRL